MYFDKLETAITDGRQLQIFKRSLWTNGVFVKLKDSLKNTISVNVSFLLRGGVLHTGLHIQRTCSQIAAASFNIVIY